MSDAELKAPESRHERAGFAWSDPFLLDRQLTEDERMIRDAAAAFAADKPGADWITLEQAVEKAKAAGYTELHGIEADDDGWEGEGMKQDGKKYEFKIDGRTGEVTKDKED